MHVKLFSTLPSLNDYEVKFPRCHFNFQKLMRFLTILFGEICLFPVFNKSRREGVRKSQCFKLEDRIFNAVTFVVA